MALGVRLLTPPPLSKQTMKKVKKVFMYVYGIIMTLLFILGCGLLEGGKIDWCFLFFGILLVMAALYNPLFPAENEEEDAV